MGWRSRDRWWWWSIDIRLKRDVIAATNRHDDHAGDDGGFYRPFDEKIFQTYSTGMEKIVEKIKAELPEIQDLA